MIWLFVAQVCFIAIVPTDTPECMQALEPPMEIGFPDLDIADVACLRRQLAGLVCGEPDLGRSAEEISELARIPPQPSDMDVASAEAEHPGD